MGLGNSLRLGRMIKAKKKEILYYAGGTAREIFAKESGKVDAKRKLLLDKLKRGEFDSESVSLAQGVHRFYKENSRPMVARFLGLPGLRVPVDLEASQALVRHVKEGRCEEQDFAFLEVEFPAFLERLAGKIDQGLRRVAEKAGDLK